jgi:hypothetical protein
MCWYSWYHTSYIKSFFKDTIYSIMRTVLLPFLFVPSITICHDWSLLAPWMHLSSSLGYDIHSPDFWFSPQCWFKVSLSSLLFSSYCLIAFIVFTTLGNGLRSLFVWDVLVFSSSGSVWAKKGLFCSSLHFSSDYHTAWYILWFTESKTPVTSSTIILGAIKTNKKLPVKLWVTAFLSLRGFIYIYLNNTLRFIWPGFFFGMYDFSVRRKM